jgi:hypothetical protein
MFGLGRTMGMMTGHTIQLRHRFMLYRRFGLTVALKTQNTAFFLQQILIVAGMRGMAELAVAAGERLMFRSARFRSLYLVMTGKAELSFIHTHFQEHFLVGCMRFMASGTISLEKRLMIAQPVHFILCGHMAGEAKQLLRLGQKISLPGVMGIMAYKTICLSSRGMDYSTAAIILLLVAFVTEFLAAAGQEAFFS